LDETHFSQPPKQTGQKARIRSSLLLPRLMRPQGSGIHVFLRLAHNYSQLRSGIAAAQSTRMFSPIIKVG
jgi:hypothetical protein